MKLSRRHRRTLSRPVRLTLFAIAATTALVIGWIAALNWNWLAPSIHDALPRHEAEAPHSTPAGQLRSLPGRRYSSWGAT